MLHCIKDVAKTAEEARAQAILKANDIDLDWVARRVRGVLREARMNNQHWHDDLL